MCEKKNTGESRIQEIPLESWEAFRSYLFSEIYSDQGFKRDRFLFRGQGSSYWKLESVFDREFPIDKYKRGMRAKLYDDMLNLFKKRLANSNISKDELDNNHRLTALGQHYGLPTRLLDWSSSPYFAAFFAFASHIRYAGTKETVAIYILNSESEIWGEQYGVKIIDVPLTSLNNRVGVQQGKFTLQQTTKPTLDAYVNEQEDNNALRKVILPASEAMTVIADLDAMGINYDSIYQDLSGIARSTFHQVLYNNPSNVLMTLKEEEVSKIIKSTSESSSSETNIRNDQKPRSALVVVDVQNDFFIGGSLPTNNAESLIEPLNKDIQMAKDSGLLIIYTQDWHPENHSSFERNGGSWPVHCIGGTKGAEFNDDLYMNDSIKIVKFGMEPESEGYSPFENPLMDYLLNWHNISNVFVTGIALEYCVLATISELAKRKISVTAIRNLIRSASPPKAKKIWDEIIDMDVNIVEDLTMEALANKAPDNNDADSDRSTKALTLASK